jgi:hypothetical protein
LSPIATDEHRLLFEVHGREREVDRLLGPQAGRVDELEERAVAEGERAVTGESIEQRVGLLRTGRVRKPPAAAAGEGHRGNAGPPER